MHQHGVAVGVGLGDSGGTGGAAGAGAVLDHEGLGSCRASWSETVRAVMSMALPAVTGTITRTGLDGQPAPPRSPAGTAAAE